jgi:hypothetical protein
MLVRTLSVPLALARKRTKKGVASKKKTIIDEELLLPSWLVIPAIRILALSTLGSTISTSLRLASGATPLVELASRNHPIDVFIRCEITTIKTT